MTKTAKAPFKLFEKQADIEAVITSIHNRGKKLDRDIWKAAVSAMAHHAKHGDVSIINKLVEAMPKGSRVNALRDFITVHGKVKYNEETKVFDHDKEGTFDLEGAMTKCWTEYKPNPEYKPFDAMKAMQHMLKKVQAADPSKGDKVTKEQAKAIAAVATSWGIEA